VQAEMPENAPVSENILAAANYIKSFPLCNRPMLFRAAAAQFSAGAGIHRS